MIRRIQRRSFIRWICNRTACMSMSLARSAAMSAVSTLSSRAIPLVTASSRPGQIRRPKGPGRRRSSRPGGATGLPLMTTSPDRYFELTHRTWTPGCSPCFHQLRREDGAELFACSRGADRKGVQQAFSLVARAEMAQALWLMVAGHPMGVMEHDAVAASLAFNILEVGLMAPALSAAAGKLARQHLPAHVAIAGVTRLVERAHACAHVSMNTH